jgi:hypothetical protein
MTIKEINERIESDYNIEKINVANTNWFPLMKYDEDYSAFNCRIKSFIN